ncbi:unnamed protein product [Didymodactylos carnosus]|uniref:FLYWCH-type domain-containing protein n=1 Tax=Didymodactylos carnosus TaxID=1234261 RepID=A0A8S2EUG8_9BILA|nr:unnamed protein product [Didymodactylos carnosus]CAF4118330.1 unnamed protein product [Didymodactylos carnosus]
METTKGKPIFIYAEYAYIVDKTSGDKTIWCCDRKRHGQCRGRIHTINDNLVLSIGEHNHEPKAEAAEMIAIRTQMANEAKMRISRDAIVIPDEFTKTIANRTFLQHDSGLKDKQMLIFAIKKQLGILERSTTIFLDGTFSVVPGLFFQLYTIHCDYMNHVFPMIYVLLPAQPEV